MALLEVAGRRFPVPLGDVAVGSDAASGIVVTGAGVLPKHALLRAQADGQVAIRRGIPTAEILVNGVRLGAEPTPLLHGDKIQLGTQEVTFVDERRSGSTQYITAMGLPDARPEAKGARPAAGTGHATANTGGRVVSLTDGREYVIAGASLVFGREAGCDIVVAGKDVSRRHAEIVQAANGYLLVDSSTNGTFVNEERVTGQRLLARADIVRIGEENFRFYADLVAAPPEAPAPARASTPPRVAPPPPVPAAAPPRASEKLRPTTMEPAARPPSPPGAPAPAAPASPRASQAPSGGRVSQSQAFATLLVTGGSLRGQRYAVRTPVVNIGRADYNDLVLTDASVSTAHAKLQRREGIFFLVDLNSTNGSFVDGERVQGEMPIAAGASLRIGDVPLVFEPTDDALGVQTGGGTAVLSSFAPLPVAAPGRASAPPAAPPQRAPESPKPPPKRAAVPEEPKKGKGCGAAVFVLIAGGLTVATILRWLLA
jgi:pSer/pThr/pTyr-binding forkhead associated (FHA) protein